MLGEAGMLLSWERRKVDLLLEFHFARSSFLYIDKSCSAAVCFSSKRPVVWDHLLVLLFQETFFSHVVPVGFTKRSKFPSLFSRERLRAVSKGILAKFYTEKNSALNSSQKFVICV